MATESLALFAYRCATSALTPAVPLLLRERVLRGKEDRGRIRERLGFASRSRPDGQLVWIHGASVGECTSVLPLIEALLNDADRYVLVTSGTTTSAKLMDERLPYCALHQFAPVDTPAGIRRFLDHWRPSVGLFVDSEIWPNMVVGAAARNIPLALINGRMSERSYAGWRRMPKMASALLANYRICLMQDAEAAERLQILGAHNVQVSGNLKADAPPLPVNAEDLAQMQRAVDNRPILLAASTHPGEEETLLPAHDNLKRRLPNLLSIVVPRHPERGGDIAILSGGRNVARRSDGALPTAETDVYIADTMGELGLFYRLAPCAFVGGSLVPHGGQNPLEAARLGRGVLSGPHTANFATEYARIFAAQGVGRVGSAGDIARLAGEWIAEPKTAHQMGKAAAEAAASLAGATETARQTVEALLANARA
jgi:3-deoxy-D-manno-octulosonic-acid transferase